MATTERWDGCSGWFLRPSLERLATGVPCKGPDAATPNRKRVRLARSVLFLSVFGCGALCAANLAHSAIAALTRAGLVVGPYESYSHGAILPTLLTACALASVAFLNVLGEALAKATRMRDDWLRHVAIHFSKISPLKLVPAMFAAQLLVLLAMERAEQVAALGHPLGLAASLGAPVLVVLAVHVLVALIVVFTISRACRALVLAAQVLADAIALPMLRVPARKPAAPNGCRLLIEVRSRIARHAPLAYHIANRPPPLSATVLA